MLNTQSTPPPALINDAIMRIVIRTAEIMEAVKELRHILNDASTYIRDYQGNMLEMPMIDFEAMLEFIFSDMDKIVKGEFSASAFVKRYILEEVLERDAEYNALLHGVFHLTETIINLTSNALLDYPMDHHAPHIYKLCEVLPSGGLVLERVCHKNYHHRSLDVDVLIRRHRRPL